MELKMYAYDIKAGDYLEMTKENGRSSGGSSYVQRVTGDDETITVTIAAGINNIDITIPANTPVDVYREA